MDIIYKRLKREVRLGREPKPVSIQTHLHNYKITGYEKSLKDIKPDFIENNDKKIVE